MSSVNKSKNTTPSGSEPTSPPERPSLNKLWIYTNYDCNLSCSYCVAESGPRVPRQPLGLETVQRLVDEAVALDFSHLYLTGGEPFLLDDIYDMLAYASAGERLDAGDVISTGTMPGCCGLELDRWIQPGQTVELEIDGIGTVTNRVSPTAVPV